MNCSVRRKSSSCSVDVYHGGWGLKQTHHVSIASRQYRSKAKRAEYAVTVAVVVVLVPRMSAGALTLTNRATRKR